MHIHEVAPGKKVNFANIREVEEAFKNASSWEEARYIGRWCLDYLASQTPFSYMSDEEKNAYYAIATKAAIGVGLSTLAAELRKK